MSDRSASILNELAKRRGVLRAKELLSAGISHRQIDAFERTGAIRREARGIYAISAAEVTEKHSIAIAAAAVPDGVVCLLSALVFHGITTQNPSEVWMAIGNKARKPRLSNPRLKIVRFSGLALGEGVEEHLVEGVKVQVYSMAKTIADLFKYRNKVGIDVAMEALREALQMKRATRDAITRAARICRVARVMQPYMESVQ